MTFNHFRGGDLSILMQLRVRVGSQYYCGEAVHANVVVRKESVSEQFYMQQQLYTLYLSKNITQESSSY